jgi:radical SAM protein with 4Fe4S-binding SPASM domain
MHAQMLRPVKVTVEITNTCNLNCVHCYKQCTRLRSESELSTEEWKRIIDDFVASGIINLFIEGGEPLFRSDFLELLRYMSPKLLTWLRTNGTLVDRTTARTLKDAGVGWVLVDILGPDADTHEYLTGTPGSFSLACDGVRHLVGAGIPVSLLLVLNRRNVGKLQSYFQLADELGARKVGVLRLYPLGKARNRWSELAINPLEAAEALSQVKVPPGVTFAPLTQSWHPNNANCCYQNASVNYKGDSIGCVYLREFVNFGDLRSTPLLETWRHPLYRKLRSGQVEQSCGDCEDSTLTRGGCRSTAYAFHRSWEALDPYCSPDQSIDVRQLPAWLTKTE